MRAKLICRLGLAASLQAMVVPGFAACGSNTPRATDTQVEDFLADPTQLLQRARTVDKLTSGVSDLLTANGRLTLRGIVDLTHTASGKQKAAIGAGMAAAANKCVQAEPQTSRAILNAVRKLSDVDLSSGFDDMLDPTVFGQINTPASMSIPSTGSTLDAPLSTTPDLGGSAGQDNVSAARKQRSLGLGSTGVWDPFASPSMPGPSRY